MQGRLIAGRFRLLRPLGEGGMGSVWIARQEQLGRDVALKLIRRRPGTDERAAERFRREAAALARLNHPHVVTVYDYGIAEDQTPFLAMELVEGPSLKERLKQGPLSEAEARALLVAIAEGLAAVHALGMVHRDIKPGNIVLPQGVLSRAKLLDFGLAKQVQIEMSDATLDAISLTQEGFVVGTPGYIAPEVALRGVSDDPRSDLYALGVIAYECVAGSAPFGGETPLALVMAHATAPRPSLLPMGVSERFAGAVQRLLAVDPEDRTPTALAAVEDLSAAAVDPSSGETSSRTSDTAPRASNAAPPSPTPPTAAPPTGAPPTGAPPTATPPTAAPPTGAPPTATPPTATPPAGAPPAGAGRAGRGAPAAVGLGLAGLAVAAIVAVVTADRSPSPQASGEPSAPRVGGHLRVGSDLPPGRPSLTPGVASLGHHLAANLVFERLAEFDRGHQLVSAVFEAMTPSDDATTLDLRLRPDVRFGPHPRCHPEGRGATADDVAASLRFISGPLNSLGVEVVRTEPLDERTLRVTFAGPTPYALPALRHGALIAAELLADPPCDNLDHLEKPVGTGPFRVVSSGNEFRIDLERVPGADTSPWVEKLSIISTPVGERCLSSLRQGALDACLIPARRHQLGELFDLAGDRPRLRPPWDSALSDVEVGKLVGLPSYELFYLLVDAQPDEVLASAAHRRALSSLLDREGSCPANLLPLSSPLPLYFAAPTAPAEAPPSAGDVAALREAVASSSRGALTLGAFGTNKRQVALCQSLTASGVPCQVKQVPPAGLAQEDKGRELDLLTIAVRDTLLDPFTRLLTLYRLVQDRAVHVPAVEAGLAAVQAAASPQQRAARLQDLLAVWRAELPLVPLCASAPQPLHGVVVLRKEFGGFFDPVLGEALTTPDPFIDPWGASSVYRRAEEGQRAGQ